MRISESLLRKIVRDVIEESSGWWGSEWEFTECDESTDNSLEEEESCEDDE